MAFWRWLLLVSGGLLGVAGLVVAAALPVQLGRTASRACALGRPTNDAIVEGVLRAADCPAFFGGSAPRSSDPAPSVSAGRAA